jgi:hypothetical protein
MFGPFISPSVYRSKGPHCSTELARALIALLVGRSAVRCSVPLDDAEVYVCFEALAATELNQIFPERQPRHTSTRVSSREGFSGSRSLYTSFTIISSF